MEFLSGDAELLNKYYSGLIGESFSLQECKSKLRQLCLLEEYAEENENFTIPFDIVTAKNIINKDIECINEGDKL